MTIVEIFNQVKSTQGTKNKKEILRNNMSSLLKQIFLDTYGVQKYFVTLSSIKGLVYAEGSSQAEVAHKTIEDNYDEFAKALNQLRTRSITGNRAKEYLADVLNQFEYNNMLVLLSVVDRNLNIGISLDNFNSILNPEEKTDKYQVSLAINVDKAPHVDPLDGTYFASRKLDGVRCEAHVNNYLDENGMLVQEVNFKSRQGKTFTTLSKLADAVFEFTSDLRGKWVLDGECCITDEEGNEDFKAIMKEITRKDHTIERPKYKLFDIITQDQFDGKEKSKDYEYRLELLRTCYDSLSIESLDRIEVLEQELLTSQEQFDKWSQRVEKNHWEGFMLHKNAPWKAGRSKDLLKVKKFQDAEYEVLDITTGKVSYPEEEGVVEYDAVTSLVIEHKGNRVDVGSGLSKEQRLAWFNHSEDIIGKTITVQYFEETCNSQGSYSLRFPVLKYVYEGKREL